MVQVLIIAFLTCAALIAVVLVKPSAEIKGHTVSLYPLVPLTGAFLLIALRSVSAGEVIGEMISASSINPVKILVLFLSMTVMSVFLDEMGFFRYLAGTVLRRAGERQTVLFASLYAMVSVLTVFTSNDIIILTFTPFICYFAKSADINPIPYLFAEFVAANTWSMTLIIGNPTNVYLATSGGIDFLRYASVMLAPSVCAGSAAFLLLYLIFRGQLKKKITVSGEAPVMSNKPAVALGLVHLGLCTLLLTVASYIGMEMWCVTLLFAVSLFAGAFVMNAFGKSPRIPVLRILGKMPFGLVPFVLSMFVVVVAMEKSGVTSYIAALLGGSGTCWKYGAASFLSANLINNIPMSVLFGSIISGIPAETADAAVYSTVIGSNICAFFTPVGALAGIMWSGILKKHDIKFSFFTYVKYGALISVPTLAAALAVLMLEL